MSWFQHLLSSELIYRMGCALFHSLWQGVLVALLLAGALAVIPRTKSSLRYWCGCIALFALPVLFCATALLVGERESVMPPIASETTTVAMDDTTTDKIDLSMSGGGTGRIDEPAVSATADIEPAKTPASATPWYSRLSDTVKPWSGHIVLCWFVGVFAMSVWNLGGWIAVRRLRCIGISTAPERFVAMLSKLAGRLGVKHSVRLLQSAVVQSPMTIGWLKPMILVPASILCELSPRQIELILAHELAHIRRFDYLVNLLQTVVETLLFHHPAVWWISHKIRSERECCCDDAVVKLTSDELNYAKALTAIADLRRDVPQLAVAAAGGSLLSRIQRILGLSNKKSLSPSTWLASLLALVICIAAAVSIVNAATAAPPHDTGARKQIVGTWEHVNSVGDNADQIKEGVWTFNSDGTFIIEGKDKDDKQHVSAGKYHFEEEKLYFTMGDEKAQTVAMLEGENLTIVFAGTKYTLRKKTATVDSAERSAFLGTWDMIEGTGSYAGKFKSVTVVFDADGRWTLESVDSKGQKDSVGGRYTSKGGRVWFRENDDIVIELDAGRMTMSDDNTTFTFKRRDDAETVSDEARPWVGSWRAEEVWDDGVKTDHVMNLELNADGTCSFLVTIDGVDHADSATYSVKGNRITFEGGQELDPSVIAILEGDTLTISGSRDRAVLKKYEPRISPLVGSWLSDGQGIMTIGESGSVTYQPFQGDAEQGMIVHSKDGKPILRNGNGEYSTTVSGDLLLIKEIGDADDSGSALKRITIDERFVGSWKSKDFTGSIDKQITALFLTLKDDSTFTLLGEGEDAGEPIKGFYQTDGDILTLRARSSDKVAMDFIKSARYDSPTIRLAIGGGAAVMSKVVHNPFDGSEHPMFRAMLTSTESQSGQIWLDLDTGNSVGKDQWELMTRPDKSMYELTLDKGTGRRIQLILASDSARLLPIRHGRDFPRAGAEALKHLPSLKKSKLRTTDYKGGISLAVLTDRGRLAVVEMMTPTATDETPIGWSLAGITQTDGDEPEVKVLRQTDPVEKETVEIKSRRVTIPDADTKNVPTILDLAGGEMLQIPDESEGVDLIGHFTKLGKGDLLFDRLFAVLRGGKAQIWKDGQWTLLTPEDRQADATAYKLPESLPCRLLVTTGDGKQFEINALARTADGGLEIEYKPVGAKVTMPGKEAAHSATHTMEYTVKPGDTLAKISEEMLGTAQRYPEIMKLNGLQKADSLTAGMVLKLP